MYMCEWKNPSKLLWLVNQPVVSWAIEKGPRGCLGYMGDYTTQIFGDHNKPQ